MTNSLSQNRSTSHGLAPGAHAGFERKAISVASGIAPARSPSQPSMASPKKTMFISSSPAPPPSPRPKAVPRNHNRKPIHSKNQIQNRNMVPSSVVAPIFDNPHGPPIPTNQSTQQSEIQTTASRPQPGKAPAVQSARPRIKTTVPVDEPRICPRYARALRETCLKPPFGQYSNHSYRLTNASRAIPTALRGHAFLTHYFIALNAPGHHRTMPEEFAECR